MSFNSLGIGLSGALSSQNALQTVGHNLSNMNTEGFNRQRTVLEARSPQTLGNLQFGRGVDMVQVERIHDQFIQQSMRTAMTKDGQYEASYSAYREIEMLFNETEGMGLNDSLTRFFDSWHDLANSPTDTSQEAASKRATVVQSAQNFITNVQGAQQYLEDLQSQYTKRVGTMVDDINQQLNSLASLNTQIARSAGMANPSHDLLDKRDNILNKLAEHIDISVDINPQGQAAVFFAGKTLVDRDHVSNLGHRITGEGSSKLTYLGPGGHTEDITRHTDGGKIASYMQMRDEVIPEYLDHVNELSRSVIEEVNKIHSDGIATNPFGAVSSQYAVENSRTPLNENTPFKIQDGSFQLRVYDDNGDEFQTFEIHIEAEDSLRKIAMKLNDVDQGGNFNARITSDNQLEIRGNNNHTFALFNDTSNTLTALGLNTFFTGHDAKSMGINSYVADDTSRLATSFTGQPGDNQNANRIAELRNQNVMMNDTMTINEYYNHFVNKVGLDVMVNGDAMESNKLILRQMEQRRESISGVNENEELTFMLKFQRSFEASSRFITTVDRLLDNIVNRMGV
ncbi:flagellar hook-associated protein FlgK [Desulfurispira natronophila]|uniref:Flagellar hook-associated protein 1 n=1 Tax=Desulfurispira natronophila TaxID=682562 RepID=A0A7W8DHW7_9BACT|nr:flagellar hook-associated protein FlgK [Desulfurispira natronophila]MBB5022728.1 flagellar hook-associated protein 1 FlgK [Desulfurispira natronophila]